MMIRMPDVRISHLSHQKAVQEAKDRLEYQRAWTDWAAKIHEKYTDPRSQRRLEREKAKLEELERKLRCIPKI